MNVKLVTLSHEYRIQLIDMMEEWLSMEDDFSPYMIRRNDYRDFDFYLENLEIKEEAIALYKKGFNCTQAVLTVFSDDLQIDREMSLKISTGFGGGLRNGELCGSVSGALMVLGMKDGHYIKGDSDRKGSANERQ